MESSLGCRTDYLKDELIICPQCPSSGFPLFRQGIGHFPGMQGAASFPSANRGSTNFCPCPCFGAFHMAKCIYVVLFSILTILGTVITVALLFAGGVREGKVLLCSSVWAPPSVSSCLCLLITLISGLYHYARSATNFIAHFLPAHLRCKSLKRKSFDLFYLRLYL